MQTYLPINTFLILIQKIKSHANTNVAQKDYIKQKGKAKKNPTTKK